MNPAEFDEWHEILPRLLIATATGALLGIDRDIHHKPAGIRVLSLVSLGGAVVVMVAARASVGPDGQIADGVTRVIQGILSGIGFLGAGVILHDQSRNDPDKMVHGLTTAASVWVAAVLGIAAGLGQWFTGAAAMALTMLILVGGRRVESWLHVVNGKERSMPPAEPRKTGE